jgi:hypothetical protein
MQSRTCQADCTWGGFGACGGEGVCSPGAVEAIGCGTCGSQQRTCDGACQWSLGGCACAGCADPRASAMAACLARFANCWDTGSAGVIGTTGGCSACNCDPIDQWQMFCYANAYDDYNCAQCNLYEIQRSHDPCNCNPGTTPGIGTWCP